MAGYTVFFTHNIFLICVWRNKEAVFQKICIKSRNDLYLYSCRLIVVLFSEQMNLKNRTLLLCVQTYQNKRFHLRKSHVTTTEKHAYISYEMQLQNHSLTLIHKNKSLPSATSNLSRSPMAHNTTSSLDKLTSTDYVDFGKCQDRFGRFSWS